MINENHRQHQYKAKEASESTHKTFPIRDLRFQNVFPKSHRMPMPLSTIQPVCVYICCMLSVMGGETVGEPTLNAQGA